MKDFTCSLRVLGCNIIIHCEDEKSFGLLRECYSAFLRESIPDSQIDLRYNISVRDLGWVMQCDEGLTHCSDRSSFLFEFEKNMTLRLQKLRAELFFVHGAVLSTDDRCFLISGASGSGKSTLAWSLCHLGLKYLSDELAPINPTNAHVEAYPHALCLKTEPLAGPPLPKSTVYTSTTMHVPAYELPDHSLEQPSIIGAMVFIDSSRNGCALEMDAISRAEAAARLYSNGLNQLAHVRDGLPAATRIARSAPSFFVTGGTVEERSSTILGLM